MDTTTRKAEAMSLLALDTLTYEQAERLDWLTAQQAGIYLEDFHKSVDACLTLYRNLTCNWSINFVPTYDPNPEVAIEDGQRQYAFLANAYTVEAIAIELLHGWWSIQPD